jgi:hypothetical protein
MPPLAVYVAAVALTGLSCFLGDRTLFRRLRVSEAGVIGFASVTLGVVAQLLAAPGWALTAVPVGVSLLLLLALMGTKILEGLLTYLAGAVYYVGLHVVASRFFGLDALIPGWPLS